MAGYADADGHGSRRWPSDTSPGRTAGDNAVLEDDLINWRGLRALYLKEVRRFLVVWVQTLLGPVIGTLLLLAVFVVVLQRRGAEVAGVSYLEFIAPGLIMMTMLQNAFANPSSSILISKLNGTISDVLSAPLGPVELTAGYALAGVTRAIVVGAAVSLALLPLDALHAAIPSRILSSGLAGALLFALLGVAGGIHAEKMEHIAFMSNVIVAPLTILSGTFYSLQQLPEALRTVALANPVFYLIDGFRQGFLGASESDPVVALAVVLGANLAVGGLCLHLFATAYRLKP
jgi:ABC-2 type transport system permease protein